MIKRPLNVRFRNPVLTGVKTSTIRNKPWPVGVPIMLYNWRDAAYRSPQLDVAPVIVRETRAIRITHREDGDMIYAYGQPQERLLHETEGFASRAELDAWFRPLVKRGETVEKAIMFFKLANRKARREVPAKEKTMNDAQSIEAGNSLPQPLGSPVDSVPAFMRDGHYVVFWIPENPDGTGSVRRGVALVCQSSALHWSGFTLTETGQIIGSINGPWKRDEVLFGYPATLADVWRAANTEGQTRGGSRVV